MSKCGCECQIYSRVVGFYRPVSHWNLAKKEEFKERLNYNVKKTKTLKKTG